MTAFSTQEGFNSISFGFSSETYFSIQKGFNALNLEMDNISLLIVRLNGEVVTGNTVLTVTADSGTYEISFTGGTTPLYPIYDAFGNVSTVSLIAEYIGARGFLNLTPDPAGIFYLDLISPGCISKNAFADFNFYDFRTAEFTIGNGCPVDCEPLTGGCNNQFERTKELYQPCLVADDVLSFMINQSTNIDYSGYKIALIDSYSNFTALTGIDLEVLDNGDGTYNYYGSFTVPCLDYGLYRIAIYNPIDNLCVFVSRVMKEANLMNWREYTRLLKYRNSVNIGGYKFEELPTFYNQVRIDINQQSMRYESEKTFYREQSTKNTRNVQSTTDKYATFKAFQFDEAAHDSFALAMDCESIDLSGITYRSFEGYSPNLDDSFDLSNGEIELYLVGFSYSSAPCT